MSFRFDVRLVAKVGNAEVHGIVWVNLVSEDDELFVLVHVDSGGVFIEVVGVAGAEFALEECAVAIAVEGSDSVAGGVVSFEQFGGEHFEIGLRHGSHRCSIHTGLEFVAEFAGEDVVHGVQECGIDGVESHFGAGGEVGAFVASGGIDFNFHFQHVVDAVFAEAQCGGSVGLSEVSFFHEHPGGGCCGGGIIDLHLSEVSVHAAGARCIDHVVHVRCLFQRVGECHGEGASAVGGVPERADVSIIGFGDVFAAAVGGGGCGRGDGKEHVADVLCSVVGSLNHGDVAGGSAVCVSQREGCAAGGSGFHVIGGEEGDVAVGFFSEADPVSVFGVFHHLISVEVRHDSHGAESGVVVHFDNVFARHDVGSFLCVFVKFETLRGSGESKQSEREQTCFIEGFHVISVCLYSIIYIKE